MNKKEKTECNYHELIYLSLQEDEDAFRHLIEKLRPIATGVFFDLLASHEEFELDEWLMKCDHLLHELVRRFHLESGRPFQPFFRCALRRAALTWQRSLQRQKAKVHHFSMDADSAEDFERTVHIRQLNGAQTSVHEGVITSMTMNSVFQEFRDKLHEQELKIISMLYDGSSKAAVQKELNVSRLTVSKALAKARAIYSELTGHNM